MTPVAQFAKVTAQPEADVALTGLRTAKVPAESTSSKRTTRDDRLQKTQPAARSQAIGSEQAA